MKLRNLCFGLILSFMRYTKVLSVGETCFSTTYCLLLDANSYCSIVVNRCMCEQRAYELDNKCVLKGACTDPSPVNGVAFTPSGSTIEAYAFITCDAGYQLVGDPLIYCQSNSTWSQTPTCGVIDCGDPTPVHGSIDNGAVFTYSSVVTVVCDTGYTLSGPGAVTCQADGSWTSYPTCNPNDCGNVAPTHGLADTPSGTALGVTATVSCLSGYTLNGDSTITCTATGWSNNPTCDIRDCGDPTPIDGTSDTPKGTTYGETAIIRCNEGFTLVGEIYITCEEDGSWSSSPSCVSVDCGDPTPENGQRTGSLFTYISVVTVSCQLGYSLVGDSSLTCQADGSWSDTSTCQPNDCGNAAPVNGQASTSLGTTLGSTATILCDTGFTFNGASTILTCTAFGWDSKPSCDIKDCGDPTPADGTAVTPQGTTYDAIAIISCDEGYSLNGESYISCKSGGTWSSEPTCVIRDCGDPTPEAGYLTNGFIFTYSSTVTVACAIGYTISGSSQITCQSDGTWSSYPTCDPSDCGTLPIVNGHANYSSGTTVGNTAIVTCNTGYTLVGSSIATCLLSGWDSLPKCTLNDCGDPTPTAGTSDTPRGTTYGSLAIITCNTGHSLNGEVFITCTEHGNWSASSTCEIRDCGDPTPSNGSLTAGTLFTYSAVVTVQCNTGYTLVGDSSIRCQADGTWDFNPECEPIDCGNASPEYGRAISPTGTTFGQTATITCDTGYSLNGPSIITCTAGGWDDTPTCDINDCGDPSPANGTAESPQGTVFGEAAFIACDPGFSLDGHSFIICQESGTWSSRATCIIKDCGDPTPDNGSVGDGDGLTFKSVVTISCDPGYFLVGSSSVTCQADGDWSDRPVCSPIDCGNPILTNGKSVSPQGTTFGQSAVISCNPGYTLVGSSIINCTATGWNSTSYCSIKDCGDPTPANGTSTIPSATTYGNVAFVTCLEGYTISGQPLIICQDNGTWSAEPICVIRDCGDPTPTHGILSEGGVFTYQSVTVLTCEEGYVLSGNSTVECQSDGAWNNYPTCEPRDCGDASPVNGIFEAPSGTTFGQTVTVDCNPGYTLDGPSTLTCTTSGWNAVPTCVIRDCGDPSPSNGIAHSPTGTTYGEQAFISCDDGFTLDGDDFITCQEDGSWSSVVNCILIECGDPTPTNGSITGSRFTYLAEVSVFCDKGFVLVGPTQISCEESGKWSEQPYCSPRDCGYLALKYGQALTPDGTLLGSNASLSCNHGYSLNGSSVVTCTSSGWERLPTCVIQDCGIVFVSDGVISYPGGTTYSEIAIVTCSRGYTLNGDILISCRQDGNWSTLPTCDIVDCGDPTPNNGTIGNTVFTYQSEVTIMCDTGFTLSGSGTGTITCLADGRWSENLVCDPNDCGNAAPVNGDISSPSGTTLGHLAIITCHNGYTLFGQSNVTCTETGWDASPICLANDCGDPSPTDGSAETPKGTAYGALAIISCNTGYSLIGDEFITCTEHGNWSAYPTCDIRDCADPTPMNGSLNSGALFTYSAVVNVTCDTGFNLSGYGSITCQADGLWTNYPNCQAKDCGKPTIVNGLAVYSDGTTLGHIADLSCNEGYILNGSSSITCKDTGWDDSPTCDVKDCGDPSPGNGSADTGRGTFFDQIAIISCNKGYTLNGETFIRCLPSGNWSSLPDCNIIDCGDPTPNGGEILSGTSYAYTHTVTVRCLTGYTILGIPTITCQSDGTWTDNPSCIPHDCGSPTPTNGHASTVLGTTIGQTAAISCDPGYSLSGASEITCTASGWDSSPTCVIKDCGDPAPVNGFSDTTKGTVFGEVAIIGCNEGHYLDGGSLIRCLADGNWSSTPSCLIKDCGDPTPDNGFRLAGLSFTYQSTVTVGCFSGFTLSSSATVTCQSDGAWDQIPTCVPFDCGRADPVNGQASTEQGTTVGKTATITCGTGYTLNGESIITCTSTGWSSQPTCAINDCGDPTPTDGSAITAKGTVYGEVAIISCRTGFIKDGETFITCQADGTWSSSPTCIIVDCGDPTPENGLIVTGSLFTYTSSVSLACDMGYTLIGTSFVTCQADGQWTDYPICQPYDCGDPTPTNGGASTPSGTTFGQKALITCNKGYTFNGTSTILTCIETGWDGSPNCIIKDCGNPSPQDGSFNSATGTVYKSTALITCLEGFNLIGDTFISCEYSGSWSSFPQCERKDCGDPTPVNGSLSVGAIFTYSAVVNVTCDSGYNLSGSFSITCQADGTWTDNPTCDATDCGSARPTDGVALVPSGTTIGQTANISCNAGYDLVGSSLLTCSPSGWNESPFCRIKNCGNPTPTNGNVETPKGTTYGAVAIISCNAGYSLIGDAFVACTEYGNWSAFPTCEIIDCGDPTPMNGSLNSGALFIYSAVVNVTCDTGFNLSGYGSITCQADGLWTNYPTCEATDCGSADPENGAAIVAFGTTIGQTANISCDVGYELLGASLITCTVSGWNEIPVCRIKDCGYPTTTDGSAETPKGTTFGAVAIISCDVGYSLIGDAFIGCTEYGNWSAFPTCEILDCGDPTPVNGSLSVDAIFTYSAVVNVTCDSGYNLSGSFAITCQADGTWTDNPTCDATDCGSARPTNGVALVPSGTTIGQIANISCNAGYDLVGSSLLTCSPSGWNESPFCRIKDCGNPTPTNGNVETPKGTTYGAVAIISCNAGYSLIGDAFVACTEYGNWSAFPTCEMIDCGDPTPMNGSLNSGALFTYSAVVNVTCDTGFNLSGYGSITCQADGLWTNYPTCEATDCGSADPENGAAIVAFGTTIGQTANISCDVGYELLGASLITCTVSGWNEIPVCCIKDCGYPTTTDGSAETPKGTTFGAVAIISCDVGYSLIGDAFIGCTEYGNWSAYPTCEVLDCGDPTPVNGSLSVDAIFTYSAVVNVTCDSGYNLSGSFSITCQADGTWTDNPTCDATDCGSARPTNGVALVPSGTTIGQIANISCNAGYDLVGSSLLTCSPSGWNESPFCRIKDCGNPTPTNGNVETPKGTTYGAVAIISCNAGYSLIGDAFVACTEYGNWSDFPTCEMIDCGDPTPMNGSLNSGALFTYSAVVNVTCDTGFNLSGYGSITCQADGLWTNYPTCEATDCGSADPENGAAIVAFGTTIGQTANISCDVGYELLGASLITCTVSGWNEIPVCRIKDCGYLTTTDGSAEIPKGTTFGAVAIISCDVGYSLIGDAFIGCTEYGTWSAFPTCEVLDCGDPTPVNGSLSVDAIFTYSAVVNVTCDSGYNLSGSFSITCQADGTWTDNPTCDATDCGSARPTNGVALVPSGTTIGQIANISCNAGYDLVGSSLLTCSPSGWNESPFCRIKDCGNPTPTNGNVETPKGTTYGAVAIISCNAGYSLIGDAFVACTEYGNWSAFPTCEIIDCGDPTPMNGSLNSGALFTYSAVVNVTCDTGFNLSGYGSITCQADGLWTNYPTCEATDCGSADPENGAAIVAFGTTIGQTANISCDVGYELLGASLITCTVSGWNEIPVCRIKDCGYPTTTDGSAETPKGTTFGAVAIISCDVGYSLIGDAFIGCTEYGTWSAFPTCEVLDCGDPTPVNGSLSVDAIFTYSAVVNVTCDSGYNLSWSFSITCQADGTWTDNPTCDATDCGSARPTNGVALVPSGTTIGQIANISCNAGYDLVGSSLLTCSPSGWNESPFCRIKDCGNPTPTNGNVETPKGTTYGAVAIISCNAGYSLIGDAFVACTEYGNWSAFPTCEIIDCGDPTPMNGSLNSGALFTYSAVVNVTCDTGFNLSGYGSITCQADGLWTNYPTCEATDCGSADPENGAAIVAFGTTIGQTANISCDVGYELLGASLIDCTVSGWSEIPVCRIKDCGYPTTTDGSAETPKGTTFGAVAIISCDVGYSLIGDAFIGCTEYGNWSAFPTCEILDCGDPTPVNGSLSVGAIFTYSAVVNVTCDSGYNLSGSFSITCQADGTWTDNPTCDATDCGSARPTNGVALVSSGTTIGQIANISCNAGYDLVGSSLLTCSPSGWNESPFCRIKDCGNPTPTNGNVETPKGTTYGALAIISCNAGYSLIGDAFVACTEYGNWSDFPTCEIIDCGDPTPMNGSLNSGALFTYSAVVNVTCDTGFNLSGYGSITCQADGLWTNYPTCEATDCGSADPENGAAIVAFGTTIGQTANISCDVGYELLGASLIDCTVSGWNEIPVCRIKDCGYPTTTDGSAETPKGTTFGAVAIISCDVGYSLIGDAFIGCTEYGTWSAFPTCEILDCGDPTPINGSLSVDAIFTYSAVVNVTCDSGYNLSGSFSITCQADGTWTDNPTCDATDCGSARPTNGVALVPSGTTIGQIANISCNAGYDLVGSSLLTCSPSGWNESPFCRIKDCGNPTPTNGNVETPKGTTYGALAIISCNAGYSLIGDAFVACTEYGNWSDFPTCEIIDCGDPTPVNGSLSGDAIFTYSAVANVTCDSGYDLSGSGLITCQADGTWTDNPTCDATDCGSPRPKHGQASTPSGTSLGAMAKVTCDDGYELNSTSIMKCAASGWDSQPTCIIKDCGDPTPPHGSAHLSGGTTYGASALILCDPGFVLTSSVYITCTNTSSWSDQAECIRECNDPSPINGRAFTSSGTTQGQQAIIVCDDGYILNGDSIINCTVNGWSSIPMCHKVDCGNPSPFNGTALTPKGTTLGEHAFIKCGYGYILDGEDFITCTSNGSWNSRPTCRYIDCGDLNIMNGTITAPQGTTVGQHAFVECNKGFQLDGARFITCQRNSTWSSFPACVLINCGDLNIMNGTITAQQGTTVGQHAFVECNKGFQLDGARFITCQENSTWSSFPACVLINCGDLNVMNGTITAPQGTTVGQHAFVECNKGFQLNGARFITCQENSTWSSFPACVLINCGILDVLNGTITAPQGTTVGKHAFVECNKGFQQNGAKFITCRENGTWSSIPTCELVDCGEYRRPYYGYIIRSTGTKYSDTALIECYTGYVLAENNTKVCQADGKWSGSASPCQLGSGSGTAQRSSESVSSASANTTLVLVCALAIFILVSMIILFICYYLKRRRKARESEDARSSSLEENLNITTTENIDEDDDVYIESPRPVSSHPPPKSFQTLPPLRSHPYIQKDKVNIVPPLRNVVLPFKIDSIAEQSMAPISSTYQDRSNRMLNSGSSISNAEGTPVSVPDDEVEYTTDLPNEQLVRALRNSLIVVSPTPNSELNESESPETVMRETLRMQNERDNLATAENQPDIDAVNSTNEHVNTSNESETGDTNHCQMFASDQEVQRIPSDFERREDSAVNLNHHSRPSSSRLLLSESNLENDTENNIGSINGTGQTIDDNEYDNDSFCSSESEGEISVHATNSPKERKDLPRLEYINYPIPRNKAKYLRSKTATVKENNVHKGYSQRLGKSAIVRKEVKAPKYAATSYTSKLNPKVKVYNPKVQTTIRPKDTDTDGLAASNRCESRLPSISDIYSKRRPSKSLSIKI